MRLHFSDIPKEALEVLRDGAVIPAHPLALDASRRLDQRRQRALTRYYIDAGAGGLAVGVHATQFAIREVGLYESVLRLAAEVARDWTRRPLVMIAGLCGATKHACEEAAVARGLGYHAGLLSLAAMKGTSEDELIAHCTTIAGEMPLVGDVPGRENSNGVQKRGRHGWWSSWRAAASEQPESYRSPRIS